MKFWQRIRLTFSSQVTRLLDDVENHEAVADELLAQARLQLAGAETRLAKLLRDREALAKQRDTARANITKWQDRARQNAASDEALALQCLERKKACETETERCDTQIRDLDELIAGVERELTESRELIGELNRRRQALAVRDLSSRALADCQEAGGSADLGRVLDRWEESVRARELVRPIDRPVGDALERRFAKEESQAELAAELAELRRQAQTGA